MHWSTRTRNITWYLLAYVLSQSACHSAYFHICPIEVFTPRSPLQPILLRTFHIWDYLVHRQTMLSLNVTSSQLLPKSELVKMLCRLPGVFCYFFLPAERKKIWKKPKQCFISGGKKVCIKHSQWTSSLFPETKSICCSKCMRPREIRLTAKLYR